MIKLPQSVKSYARRKIRQWPTLYGHPNEDHGILACLGHLYFCLGNGLVWKDGKPKRERLRKRSSEIMREGQSIFQPLIAVLITLYKNPKK